MTKNSINNTTSDLQVSAINIAGSTISTTTSNTNLSLTPNGIGKVSISGAYTLPNTDGILKQGFQTNGAGVVNFVNTPTVITQINIQTFTSSGVYTPTAGLVQAIIEVVGGGGGGSGTSATGVATCSAGAGGGGGGYSKGLFSAVTIGASQVVTIGAGGNGGNGGASIAGGTTSVGSLISATGGGSAALALANSQNGVFGGLGGVGSSGFINATGTAGEPGFGIVSTGFFSYTLAGTGGRSTLGNGGKEIITNPFAGVSFNGNNATGFGGGGGSALTGFNNTAKIGGNGFPGVVIITEYIS